MQVPKTGVPRSPHTTFSDTASTADVSSIMPGVPAAPTFQAYVPIQQSLASYPQPAYPQLAPPIARPVVKFPKTSSGLPKKPSIHNGKIRIYYILTRSCLYMVITVLVVGSLSGLSIVLGRTVRSIPMMSLGKAGWTFLPHLAIYTFASTAIGQVIFFVKAQLEHKSIEAQLKQARESCNAHIQGQVYYSSTDFLTYFEGLSFVTPEMIRDSLPTFQALLTFILSHPDHREQDSQRCQELITWCLQQLPHTE